MKYTYHRAVRGARDSLGGVRGGGPPLEPDEPAHCEVDAVRISPCGGLGQEEISHFLSDGQIEALGEECMEHEAGEREAAAEFKEEVRRDVREL